MSLSPTCTHRVPSSTYQASSPAWWRWRGAIRGGGPGGPPASCHSATTKESFGEPKMFPARGGAMMREFIVVDLVVASFAFETLRVTPAMQAGLTHRIWGIEELWSARPPLKRALDRATSDKDRASWK